MKAIVFTQYGPPEVLRFLEVEKPAPKDGEILIQVHAVEATKADCELRSLHFPVKWFSLPVRIALGWSKPRKQILGSYFSGEVVSAGGKVTRFKPGDAVFGATKFKLGAYGEFLCLPANYTIAPKPANLSFEEAAVVPLGGLNAIHFLRRANIRPGESVLVNGAGASIGTFGVQIAKAMGAEVTAVDSGIKEDMLRRIGADHFIDYAREDFTQSGQSYDVIFNMVAGCSFSGCLKSLRPGGRYLMANPRLSDILRSLLLRSLAPARLTGKKAIFAFAEEKEEELLALKQKIEDGKLKPVVDKVFPLEEAAQAHRRVEAEERIGCVVLSMG